MTRITPIDTSIEIIYDECIANCREDTKHFFEEKREYVINSSNSYANCAEQGELHNFRIERINNEDKEKFLKIYTDKLRNKNLNVRKYYNKILSLTSDGLCVYCGQETANTLDHFMPKAHYWTLAVTPTNLLPSCGRCNKLKSDKIIVEPCEVLYNPYFEDINQYEWLIGILEHTVLTEPLTMRFVINTNAVNDQLKIKRLINYFSVFRLNELYSIYASQKLRRMTDLHKKKIVKFFPEVDVAMEKIREELDENIELKENISIWEMALYKAIRNDTWYFDEYLFSYIKQLRLNKI